MDSLNFFVGIHWAARDIWGDIHLLSKSYQFHHRTIWIIRYTVAAPVQFGSLFLALFWPNAGGWFILPWLAFNLLVFPPFMLWLLVRLSIITRKSTPDGP
ncbi:MAG: hypothetical protein M3Q36_03110 [bacterium]|nr:hypothetical protein [bacterium]